jgi:hypothetical protein
MYQMDASSAHAAIRVATLISIGGLALFLVVMAILVRYTQHMRAKPWSFAIETAAIGVFAAVPLYLIAYNRHSSYWRVTLSSAAVIAKVAGFWVLMELAGVNDYIFPVRKSYLAKHGLTS